MAIDVQAIICPQCGTTDIDFLSETQGVCKSCGAQIAVRPQIETQNVYNEVYINTTPLAENMPDENPCAKMKIISEHTKDQFIRNAWIELAKDDAPIEVFDLNFAPVSENEHEILIDSISVDVTYQTSVGYDRQEPYTDYEDYWEKEPYITTETYYDSNFKQNRTRQVTKYKDVKKQRQVTKYKTVTDWSPLTGEHSTKSVAIVNNKNKQYFDHDLFRESFYGAKDTSFSPVSAELAEQMQITKVAQDNALDEHKSSISYFVGRSLPGDHFKDLSWKVVKTTESESKLYKVPEYETCLSFNGKTYVKRAFPFGAMNIAGDKVKNEISLDSIKHKMREELKNKNKERKDAIDKNISQETNRISLVTIVLLLTSIFISIMRWSPKLIVGAFIIAILSFITNKIALKAATKAEEKCAEKDIADATDKVENEIADYSKKHKVKLREVLDNKLKSLGYEPTSSDEVFFLDEADFSNELDFDEL